jgi:hypothetical protein
MVDLVKVLVVVLSVIIVASLDILKRIVLSGNVSRLMVVILVVKMVARMLVV